MRSRTRTHAALLVMLAVVVAGLSAWPAAGLNSSMTTKSDPIDDLEALKGGKSANASVRKATDLTSVAFGSGVGRSSFKLRWCTRKASSPSLSPGTSYAYKAIVAYPGAAVMVGEIIVYVSPDGVRTGTVGLQGSSASVRSKVDSNCVTASVPVAAFPSHVSRLQLAMGTEIVNFSPRFTLMDHGPARWIDLR
ncbi:hypothetical protein [Nocardioides iriomotensis]|uniref:Uncharacterized protein n=1 Tax=Nocardioides iriomotensis TaxID=715784 RepID=A0A4Q5J8A1_9ACTN|nr:hypothetical protein [Nocardioides iriomotensis]RYU13895.1 hypothetical protein ETU37_05055 [Nocardioides iriomotensis]